MRNGSCLEGWGECLGSEERLGRGLWKELECLWEGQPAAEPVWVPRGGLRSFARRKSTSSLGSPGGAWPVGPASSPPTSRQPPVSRVHLLPFPVSALKTTVVLYASLGPQSPAPQRAEGRPQSAGGERGWPRGRHSPAVIDEQTQQNEHQQGQGCQDGEQEDGVVGANVLDA